MGSSSSWGATRGPHSAPHVLFAFSHAWRVSAVDSGTGGSPELGDHAAVYAPDSSHVRGDGQAAESTNRCPRCWRHIGDGAIADDELTDSTRVKWWRRRESNPRPRVRCRRTLHACPPLKFSPPTSKGGGNRRRPSPDASHRRVAVPRATTSPLYDAYPRPVGAARVSALLN